ncbi:MAG: polysaccharide biosynthesis tyrosine autokinase, partial [Muribaculaceae bacterium]|nr:polysaccharide biosynthesis tyrosine autokinase [Muribaculaceae bacterium]
MSEKENQEQLQQLDQESLDITGLCLELLAKWKWFILSLVVCIGVAWYHLACIIPVYSVKASIYLNNESTSSSSSIFSDQAQILNLKNRIDDAELMILKSRNNLMKVVDSLDLSYTYYTVGKFRDRVGYGNNPVIARLDSVSLYNLKSPINIYCDYDDGKYHFKVISDLGKVTEKKVFNVEKLPVQVELSQGTLTLMPSPTGDRFEDEQRIVITNPYTVAAQISGNLNIEFAQNSNTIVNIDYSTTSAPMGVDVINTLIKIYNQDIWTEKNRSAMQTEQFIVERLALVEAELNDAERDVESFRLANNVTDLNSETSMALTRSQEADRQLAELDVRQRIVNEVERVVASQDDYSTLPQVIDDPNLNASITAYNKKVAQRAALLEGSTENNPIVKNLQEDIARSRNDIYRGIVNLRNSINTQRNSIARQESRANSRLSSIPVNERELFGRIRKQTVKENIYNYLLEKREEISIQKTLATPQARLIDNPALSGLVYPNTRMTYIIAVAIALLIPGLIVFCRFVFFPNFRDKEDLARATRVPVIGEISLSDGTKEFVVSKSESTAIAELFRLLRNNLQFITGKDGKVILVTSTLSGEGKTFVSSNIALTFALAGKKTLAVGMDIRRPFLAHRFNRTNDRGVTSYLSGQDTDLDSMISKSDQHDNLYILSAGPVPPNPNELLMSDKMEELLGRLRERFDYIIIDSAPIGVVSDTLLIAPLTDLQLYVARANYSTKK